MAIYNLDMISRPINEGYVNIEGRNNLHIKHVTAVCVHSIEGDNIPHFHLERDKKLSDICIRLDTNEFFTHGEKEDMLNNSDCRELNRWLMLENTKYRSSITSKFFTNWQVLATFWNARGRGIIDLLDQPDYETIRPYKE